MSRFFTYPSQLAVAALLLVCTLHTSASEAPNTRLSLAGINHLNFSGDVKVTLTQSDENSAHVFIDKGKLENVDIEQEGDSLWIGNSGRGFWSWFKADKSSEVRINIKISSLKGIDASGSVDITAHNMSTDQLTIDLSGASQLTAHVVEAQHVSLDLSGASTLTLAEIKSHALSADVSGASRVHITDGGNLATQTLDVSGASHFNSAAVMAKIVKADVSGASHSKVTASQELSANVSGASSLAYNGDPKLQVNTSGASSINKL
ncbi:GIN domain-containing protein [Gilvimarinus agarilyticus]|uniref:GIN domain-containing protein n=1 Tax=Gilvimarinus agarilyticus TaxID=679259 RepID=UPI000698CB13|nr:DUF2807 domain-containing protein [Gilvimarinus agarilyticus]